MRKLSNILAFALLAVFTQLAYAAGASSSVGNHEFQGVKIKYRMGGLCSFQYSPVYFCDDRHIYEIKKAIVNEKVNFNHHYILVSIFGEQGVF